MMTLYEKALRLAVKAHAGQVRKHDATPYIYHPIMVARIVEQAGFSEEIVAAALVHDVLEDTTVTEAELRQALGDTVADIVTAVSEDTDLEWEERKRQYIEHVVGAGEEVWAVSVADKIHNAADLAAFHALTGTHAWTIFNRGKEKKLWFETELLQSLKAVWNHPLLQTYEAQIAILQSLSD